MDCVISELCYKGILLQRNYRKMTISWSFSYNSFVKLKWSFSYNSFVKLKWSFFLQLLCKIEMVILLIFLCKTPWYKNLGATTSLHYIHIDVIMQCVIKGLHCT